MQDLNLRIGGKAGFGIFTAAALLGKTSKDDGLWSYVSTEYPSLIRGGHNYADVRIGPQEIHCNCHRVDILLALNTETIERHTKDLSDDAIVLYDSKETELTEKKDSANYVDIPIDKIAEEHGSKRMRNTVIVAAALAIIKIDPNHLHNVLTKIFTRKGEEMVKMNIVCADATKKYIDEHYTKEHDFQKMKRTDLSNHLFLGGNDSLTMGALKAGCKFMSAYPMTPATSIMETMVKHEKDLDVVMKHVEDELTSINMASGAAFAGVRSMTASSGGGISLMIEGFGAAIQEENPIVVVCATRAGPGSGMATYTSQGDINLCVYSGTDDAPRIVLAPGDTEEFFYITFEAFNYAEEFQTPVFILTDKQIESSKKVIPYYKMDDLKINRGKLLKPGDLDKYDNYLRYQITEGDPVSPRTRPGIKNGMHVLSSYVHDERGTECEDPENRMAMLEKLFNKMELAKKRIPFGTIKGDDKADVSIITWGSSKQYVDQIMEEMDDVKIRHMCVNRISPFPTEEVTKFIDSAKKILLIEQNYQGQFNDLIKLHCQRVLADTILHYDGYTIDTEKVKKKIREIAK